VPPTAEEPGGIEHPSVDLELVLESGSITDTDRNTCPVTGPAFQLSFMAAVATMNVEQNRQPRSI
jgi:hypothetical protein